jgi:hypothetical protein
MNDEKLAIDTLKALGAKDTTSNAQKKNGTTCFTLPTGSCVSEHKTGYIRKNLLNLKGGIYTCYQLNPTYTSDYQVIAQDGKLYTFKGKKRMMIMPRKLRLKQLFLYTIKKLNNG